MRKRIAFIIAITAVMLTACGKQDASVSQGTDSGQTEITREEFYGDDEDVVPTSDDVIDHKVGNMLIKVWAGKENTEDYKDESGFVMSGRSYANHIAIRYNVTSNQKDLEMLITDALTRDVSEKITYPKYDIEYIKKAEDKAWAKVWYSDGTTEGTSYIFVLDGETPVMGEVSYFSKLLPGNESYIAKQEDIDKIVNAYEFEVEADPMDIKIDLDERRPILPIDMTDSDGKKLTTAYSWDGDPAFDYPDTYMTSSSSDQFSEEMYVCGFTTGIRGVYVSVQAFDGKTNPKNAVNSYIENMEYLSAADMKYSDVVVDGDKAYAAFHYGYDKDRYNTIIYLVVQDEKCYKTVLIEASPDADVGYFNEACQAYGVQDQETTHEYAINDSSATEDTTSAGEEPAPATASEAD